MSIQVTLPEFGQKLGTKDQIISILSRRWPLNIKKIHNQLKKQYRSPTTYQAVHKAVLDLEKQRVLVKQEKEYQINIKWLNDISRFASSVKENYLEREELPIPEGIKHLPVEGLINVLTFNTILEADYFVVNFETKTDKIRVGHARHFWWALFYLQKSFDMRTKEVLNRTYGLCRGDTILDRWCVNFENSIGMHSKTCPEIAGTCDLYVYDDYVIQVYFPLDLIEKIDDIYKKTNIIDLDFRMMFKEIFEKPTEVQVVINKNPKLADTIRKKTLEYFKKK